MSNTPEQPGKRRDIVFRHSESKKATEYPAIIENFPEHAKLMGFIAAEWSQIEHKLVMSLSLTMSADSKTVRPMIYAIESSGARLSAIRAAFAVLLGVDSKPLGTIDHLIERARSVLAQRNKFMHSLYGISGTGELAIVGIAKGQAGDLPLHDLQHQFDRAKELSHDVGAILSQLIELTKKEIADASLPD